jgi:hypothetical protein
MLSAICVFHAIGHAASATMRWSIVKYATTAENGFVDGSLDKTTIVDRTFRTYVLENRFLKVTLLPEFGGRILSIIYKPTGHEQLYRTEVGVPYGIKAGNFYYDWLMVYGDIFATFPDAEHGKTWLKPWDFKVVKQAVGEVTVSMSLKDDLEYPAAPRKFRKGSTGIEATCGVTLKADRAALDARVVPKNPRAETTAMSTGRARRLPRDRSRKTPKPLAVPKSSRRSGPTARPTGRKICPRAMSRRDQAGNVSRSCAFSRTGRRWASPMLRLTWGLRISGV